MPRKSGLRNFRPPRARRVLESLDLEEMPHAGIRCDAVAGMWRVNSIVKAPEYLCLTEEKNLDCRPDYLAGYEVLAREEIRSLFNICWGQTAASQFDQLPMNKQQTRNHAPSSYSQLLAREDQQDVIAQRPGRGAPRSRNNVTLHCASHAVDLERGSQSRASIVPRGLWSSRLASGWRKRHTFD